MITDEWLYNVAIYSDSSYIKMLGKELLEARELIKYLAIENPSYDDACCRICGSYNETKENLVHNGDCYLYKG